MKQMQQNQKLSFSECLWRIRRLLAIPVILAGVLLGVLCNNIHAVREGYSDLSLGELLHEPEGGCILTYENEDGIYIRELSVLGSFEAASAYSLKLTGQNAFGKEETEIIKDQINPAVPWQSTMVRKRITRLELIVAGTFEGEISDVFISNRFEWNKQFMIALAACLLLFYLFLFERKLFPTPERVFLVFAAVFGSVLILTTGYAHKSWDEGAHFKNAYRIASGSELTAAERFIEEYANIKKSYYNTRLEQEQLKELLDEKQTQILRNATGLKIRFTDIGYLPFALFLWIGLLLKLPFHILYTFGRFGSLLIYLIIMTVVIRKAQAQKSFVTFIAMCPTTLYLAVNYTCDTFCFELLTLGSVLFFREYLSEKMQPDPWVMICAAVLFVLGSASKAVYIPILLLLLLPLARGRATWKKTAAILVTVGLLLAVMSTFVLPLLKDIIANNAPLPGDPRGGDTSPMTQILSMLSHPWQAFLMFIHDIFQFDNFRNLGTVKGDSYTFLNLMLLNFGYYGVLKDKWCIILAPLLFLLLREGPARRPACVTAPESGNENTDLPRSLTVPERWITGVILFVIVFLIWMAMYLVFSEVGAPEIKGVQARYYIPLLYPLAMIFYTRDAKSPAVGAVWKYGMPFLFFVLLLFGNVLLL